MARRLFAIACVALVACGAPAAPTATSLPPPTATRPPPPPSATPAATPTPGPRVPPPIKGPDGQPLPTPTEIVFLPLDLTRGPFPERAVPVTPEPPDIVVGGVVVDPTPTAPPPGAAAARVAVEQALTGTPRDEVLSMLIAAERVGREQERYETYRGVWQYLRDLYLERGRPDDVRATLDAVEAVARSFSMYSATEFALPAA